jgi:hypothetical protein
LPFQTNPDLEGHITEDGVVILDPVDLLIEGIGVGQVIIGKVYDTWVYRKSEGNTCKLPDGPIPIEYHEVNGELLFNPTTLPIVVHAVSIDSHNLGRDEMLECTMTYRDMRLRGVDENNLMNIRSGYNMSNEIYFGAWVDMKERHKPADYIFNQRPDLFKDIWFVLDKKPAVNQ